MCVEAAKDFYPSRFLASFFLASKRVQRVKSQPLAFFNDARSVVPLS